MADGSVVRNDGEGDAYWFLGGLYEVRLSSDETNGAVTLMQFTIPEGMAPPLHVHDGDETVTVLEGRARFHIGDETVELGPGAAVFFPAGTQETFEPIGQVKTLVAYTPGGIDKFFAEVGERASTREIPPPPEGPPDFAHLAEVAERNGLRLIGPPGA